MPVSTSTDWISPSGATNLDQASGPAWSSLSNVYSSNNSRASVSIPSDKFYSDIILASFGSGISSALPPDATIDGIEARVEGYRTANDGYQAFNLWDTVFGGGDSFGSPSGGFFYVPLGSSVDEAYTTAGASTDKWGVTRDGGLNRSHLVASTFRLAFFGACNRVTGYTLYVDHIQIKVHYTYAPLDASSGANVLFWSAP